MSVKKNTVHSQLDNTHVHVH